MPCPACGTPAPEGARFCSSCGRALVVRQDERRVATVLFADLVGFTSYAEGADPEHVKQLVDRCFERLVSDLTDFGGQVDKIVGDAIVALFGAPLAHEDDAERAVRAALRMQRTLGELRRDHAIAVEMRIGVNSGEVLAGALRAGGEYTAMGDVVNTASRLQTEAAPGEVLVGPETYAVTAAVVRYEPRGLVVIRGREAPVEVWRALEEVVPPGQRRNRSRAPLVGRSVELELLGGALRNAMTRHRAQLVLLTGEAGVGKTRLALELRSIAEREHQARVLLGHCVPYGEANVWFPLAEALRGLFDLKPQAGREESEAACRAGVAPLTGLAEDDPELTRLVEGLMTMLGYVDDAVEPSRARDEAERAVLTCLDAMTAEDPLAFALADLHWADDVVLELVERVLSRMRGRPFVLFATSRPELAERWTPKLGGYDVLMLQLEPLDAAASEELSRALLGPDAPEDLVVMLRDRSGGNPFFIEELATVIAERDDGIVTTRGRSRPATVPATLRGLVASRLDALEPADRAVLDDCAVVGANGRVAIVEALGRDHELDVSAALTRLVDKDLIELTDGKFTFRSELIRDVAYNTLTKAERARRHLSVAGHLTHWAEDSERLETVLDLLARHYGAAAALADELGSVDGVPADLDARAVEYLERAAARAERQERWRNAAELLTIGLKLAGNYPSRRDDLLVARARARAELRDLAAARADAQTLLDESRGRENQRGIAGGLTVMGKIQSKEGDNAAAAVTLDEAVQRWRDIGDRPGLAEALREQGMNQLFIGEHVEAEAHIAEALELSRVDHDQRGEAWALQNLAWIAFNNGNLTLADERLHESAHTFGEIGDWGGLAWALGLLAWVRWMQGNHEEAETLAHQAFGRTGESGDPWASSMMLVLLANVALWRGDLDVAIEHGERARRRFQEIENAWGELQATIPIALAMLALGRVADTRAEARRVWALSEAIQDPMGTAAAALESAIAIRLGDADAVEITLAGLRDQTHVFDDHRLAAGFAQLQAGSVDDAITTLEDALEVASESGVSAPLAAALGLAYVAAGRVDEALALHEERLHSAVTYLDRIQFAFLRAFASLRQGRFEEARIAADDAVTTADGTQSRLEQAVTRLARAAVLTRTGAVDASAQLADADERLDDIGIDAVGWRRLFARLAQPQT
ncbi:MAG: AAA family ATPase [Actinobacteria bacterium]|nr:AAA family ATPase [Actinomycetota bacterium]